MSRRKSREDGLSYLFVLSAVHCNMYLQRTDVLIHLIEGGGNGGKYVYYLRSKERRTHVMGRLRYPNECNADLQCYQPIKPLSYDRGQ